MVRYQDRLLIAEGQFVSICTFSPWSCTIARCLLSPHKQDQADSMKQRGLISFTYPGETINELYLLSVEIFIVR